MAKATNATPAIESMHLEKQPGMVFTWDQAKRIGAFAMPVVLNIPFGMKPSFRLILER